MINCGGSEERFVTGDGYVRDERVMKPLSNLQVFIRRAGIATQRRTFACAKPCAHPFLPTLLSSTYSLHFTAIFCFLFVLPREYHYIHYCTLHIETTYAGRHAI
jgi:hypothetical protein